MPVWGWVLIGIGVFVIIMCIGSFAALTYLGQQVNTTFSRIGSGLVVIEDSASPEPGFGSDNLSSVFASGAVVIFYSHLESGDYEAAWDLLSSDMQSRYSADDLRTKWEALRESVGDVTAENPNAESATDSMVKISQELSSSSGETYTIRLQLESDGGSLWLITQADPALIPEP
jgi:hypothetical protein